MTARTLGLVSLCVASLLMTPAEAKVEQTIKRVEYFSDQVWDNQLNGAPVVAFPLGCRGRACDFTIWLQFFPGTGDPNSDCTDDPETEQVFECEINNHCVLWVEFNPSIMPLSDWHGWNWALDEPADSAIISDTWNNGDGRRRHTGFTWNGHNAFHGASFEILVVLAAEVDIFHNGLCRTGLSTLYYPNSKTLFDRGYILPR